MRVLHVNSPPLPFLLSTHTSPLTLGSPGQGVRRLQRPHGAHRGHDIGNGQGHHRRIQNQVCSPCLILKLFFSLLSTFRYHPDGPDGVELDIDFTPPFRRIPLIKGLEVTSLLRILAALTTTIARRARVRATAGSCSHGRLQIFPACSLFHPWFVSMITCFCFINTRRAAEPAGQGQRRSAVPGAQCDRSSPLDPWSLCNAAR